MSTNRTAEALFAEYDRQPGDREAMLRAVASWRPFERVLYAGSYVDITPSFVLPDVTYVDTDRRAARFFADRTGVDGVIRGRRPRGSGVATWRFLHADYTQPLDVADGSVDLVISLYAGFVSEHCMRYLRHGGVLLANDSHGDASLASLDAGLRLVAVVTPHESGYRVVEEDVSSYLEPHVADLEVTAELLRRTGRGVRYRTPAAAYLFERR